MIEIYKWQAYVVPILTFALGYLMALYTLPRFIGAYRDDIRKKLGLDEKVEVEPVPAEQPEPEPDFVVVGKGADQMKVPLADLVLIDEFELGHYEEDKFRYRVYRHRLNEDCLLLRGAGSMICNVFKASHMRKWLADRLGIPHVDSVLPYPVYAPVKNSFGGYDPFMPIKDNNGEVDIDND